MWRMVIVLVIMVLSVNTALALSGSGTQEDPWQIESAADFNEFAADANYWAGFTRLETDVNLAGLTYTTAVIAPDINNSNWDFDGTAFTGVFDGNDHKIINLTIDGGGAGNDYLGLFGYIYYGQVENLGLEGGSVRGVDWAVGGLVGYNYHGSVSNCYSTGVVNGTSRYVGGLVGYNYHGSVSNCYSTGDVNGVEYVGGLVGKNMFRSVSNCYSTGDVSGEDWVGGLVGYSGGLSMPYGSGSVSNCYSTSDVNGVMYVGGLLGGNGSGSVSNSYSTGAVSGGLGVGGLVSINKGRVSNCFWDVETSGLTHSAGGTGKTTAQMQTKSTFTDASWDFVEIWLINEGATYPVLRQEIRCDLNGDGAVDLRDFAIFATHWLEEE